MLEEFAKKLQLPMIDATSGEDVVRSAEDADVSFREKTAQGGQAVEFPEPPPNLKIDYAIEGSEIHFTLPRAGFRGAAIFLAVFAVFWNGFIFMFIMALLSGNVESASPRLFMLLFLLPFIAVGVGLAVGVCFMVRAQTHVLASPQHVTSYATLWGKDWRIKSIPCDEIEEIELHQADESGTQSIYIRSDTVSLDVGGTLPQPDRQWLCDAIKAIVAA